MTAADTLDHNARMSEAERPSFEQLLKKLEGIVTQLNVEVGEVELDRRALPRLLARLQEAVEQRAHRLGVRAGVLDPHLVGPARAGRRRTPAACSGRSAGRCCARR